MMCIRIASIVAFALVAAAASADEYVYDALDQLVEVRRGESILVRFQYDFEGRVIKRIGVQGIRQYTYDGHRVLAEYNETGALVASYAWGNDRILSINRPGQAALFPQYDAFGSIITLADPEGDVVARYHYDAWGALRFPDELAADQNRFGYTGHRWDEEIDLYSTPTRRFDPALGRFTTQDSYLGEPGQPLSLHRYLYGNANPTRYTDPTGHWSWEGIWEGVKGLPRAAAEPALWVYDTALVIGASGMGIPADHIELQSALGRRQQARIEEGQAPATAASKGAIEAPLAVATLGTSSVAQGHYELYESFRHGEISIDEYDRQLSRMAGLQAGAAALGTGGARVTGRSWTGRSVQEATRSGKAHVVVEGNESNVLVPVERPPAAVDKVPPPLPRFAAVSQGIDTPAAAQDAATTVSPAAVAPRPVPNPYGKLGSPAHQAKVREVVADIRARGLRVETEAPIPTVGGAKDMRYMDVVAIDPATGKIVEVHQVGRVLKSDPHVPVARERTALRDVRRSPELRAAKRIFHEY